MKRSRNLMGVLLLASPLGLMAQQAVPASEPVPVVRAFFGAVARMFGPAAFNGDIERLTGTLLLVSQMIAFVIVVGGLVFKLRKDHHGDGTMDTFATAILLSAFIATVPTWRDMALRSGNSLADAIGYKAVNYDAQTVGTMTPMMGKVASLASLWAPTSSAAAEQAEEMQENGQEQHDQPWYSRTWRFISGAASAAWNGVKAVWVGVSGVFRHALLLLTCIFMFTTLMFASVLYYAGEFLRYFLMYVGCAMLPVFIAGLGTEFFKGQAQKFILGLVGIALWPVAWSIANIATVVLIDVAITVCQHLLTAALAGMGAGAVIPGAQPMMAMGAMLTWASLGIMVVMCFIVFVYQMLSIIAAPFIMGKVVTSGSQFMGGMFSAGATTALAAGATATAAAATVASGGTAAPIAGMLMSGMKGMMSFGSAAAKGASTVAKGASVAGANGSSGAAVAARGGNAPLLAKSSSGGASAPGGGNGAGGGGAQGSEQGGNQRVASALMGASRIMSMAARLNPDREHSHFGEVFLRPHDRAMERERRRRGE